MQKPNAPTPSPANSGPTWWTDKHTSAWDRVRDAFQRDWEQTKADFSSTGKDLKQSAADTAKQMLGSEPIPRPEERTHPLELKDLEKARQKLDASHLETAKVVDSAKANIEGAHAALKDDLRGARKAAAEQTSKLEEARVEAKDDARHAIAEAQDRAGEALAKEHERVAKALTEQEQAQKTWNEAEREARYGYGARQQYGAAQAWDDALEEKLRVEWSGMKTGRSWDSSRDEVRRGWDYGSKSKPHQSGKGGASE